MSDPKRFLAGMSRQLAFTLLELVVATAIFSVLSVVAYSGLRNFMVAEEVLVERDREFSTLQSAINLVERDLKNALTRRIRDEFGDHVAAMQSSDGNLEFTRFRPGVPPEFSLVDMVRVDYVFANNILWRRAWHQLDRVPQTGFEERMVLEGIDSLSWEFYRDTWQDYWPLAADPYSQSRLPRAVRLTVNLVDGRRVERVILIENQG